MAEDIVVVTGQEKYRTAMSFDGHELIADEPESVGGKNLGPTPYDLLCGALGACTGMTLRMYADRKAWPMEAVEVRLRHEKIHADDCADCETKEGKIDQITRELVIYGELSDEQKQRLVEIADRCPVHRTLHSEIKVVNRLAE